MTRVAVIGAGPSGLAQLQAFAAARDGGAEIPEIVCFEKQADWGGLWNYTWRTGLDDAGQPVHGSMYRYLWSNGPKECLEFADYTFEEHFGKAIGSFPPRPVLYDYITGRSAKSGVRDLIHFNHRVDLVDWSEEDAQFTVQTTNTETNESATADFDYVVVSTGHFSMPNMPAYPGYDGFNGRILHAHDFRDATEFADKNVVVIGSSYSAEDIASQCWKYGAKSVIITARNGPTGFSWPEGISERPILSGVSGSEITFSDGSTAEADAIISCTGYRHSFPFMEPSLRLEATNRLATEHLYRGVVFDGNERLFYLGMQDQWYTFNMFDAQAWYVRDVIMGSQLLPDPDARRAWLEDWTAREDALTSDYEAIDFQGDYTRELAELTDYPPFDIDQINQMFKDWKGHKKADIMGYRNNSHRSPVTGTPSPVHHTGWLEALDDSLEVFIGSPNA